jgi:type IV pilus assembly protein PilY1
MRPYFPARSLFATLAIAAALGARPAGAATTDLSPVPLGTASSTSVLPNLMFVLDDSGSMGRYWMPDNVDASNTCKAHRTHSTSGTNRTSCIVDSGNTNLVPQAADSNYVDDVRHIPQQEWPAGPPAFAAEFNTIYYNPQITYLPGKDGAGADMPSYGSPWTSVRVNPYLSTSTNTVDLTTQWPEPVFCDTSTDDPNSNTECRRNGYDSTGTTLLTSFRYSNASAPTDGSFGWPIGTGGSDYRYLRMRFGAPHYFTILPREHCSDIDLTTCTLSSTPTGSFTIPAPVRYCTTGTAANQTAVVTGGTPPTCQAKLDSSHQNVRYGTFVRTDIVPTVTTYGGRPSRSDCVAQPVCTYAEEMTNFANWFAYYHTRMQMMKGAAGRVFSSMDDRYRIGFVTINASDSTRYLKIDKFDVPHKASWYTTFYDMTPSGLTPLRRALSRVGRHFGGKQDGINDFMLDDPIQYSCQQNFALLTTDGYWNSSGGRKLDGTTGMDNQDNLVETFVNRPTGTLDGGGTNVTDSSTTRTLEQVVCTANTTANFSGSPDTVCGCPANLKRVKQRQLDDITSTTCVDGVCGPPTTNTVSSFQDITACDATQVNQATPVTVVERLVCSGSNTVNFTYGGSRSCNCNSGRRQYIRQTKTGATRDVTTYDGGAPVTTVTGGANAYHYSLNGSTWVTTPYSGSGCTSSSLTATAPVITPTGGTTTTTTGSTITSANFTVTPNPTVLNLGASSTTVAGGFSDTLADAAMYYYKSDLRPCPGGTPASGKCLTDPKATDNVPITVGVDEAPHQHMVTFTLGLGLDGLMNYQSDYKTANSGDFKKIKDGVTGCSFAPGGTTSICNWPQPVADSPTALDDLWHAAVNGRGTYFSAKNPNTLQSGLTSALQAIKTTTGAAASSATSTPNVTPTDNFIYSSTYRTVKWDGEVVAEKIDVVTGNIIPGVAWTVGSKLDPRTLSASDDRSIFTLDLSNKQLKPFTYGSLTGTEQGFFNNHCTLNPTVWPQCGPMSPADLAVANSGTNLVNFLRGQDQHEVNYYRIREHTLGDTVNAKPAFLGKPNLLYGDAVVPDYNSFKSGPAASRTPVLFIAANDGMLHAIHGGEDAVGGGTELWAYVPRMLLPELYKLAASNYDVNHRFYVDGSPVTMDVFIGGAWKTILVGGLNAGGRGYFALDVTDTSNPKGMWEVCADPTGTLGCDAKDDNFGYSYGQPIITKRPTDGKWVVIVTSGYNNVSPGDGKGYLFVLDAETGQILDKVDTGVGDTVTPSGLAKISGFATNFTVNNTTTLVYGGDLLGNVWRFDMSTSGPTVQLIGQTLDSAGNPQSITTRPEITRFDAGFNVIYVATGRFLGSSDIQDPLTLAPPENRAYQQTIYGFKDTGTNLGSLRDPVAGLVQQVMSLIDANTRTISNNAVTWSTQNGWWVDLNPSNASPGERVNIDPQLVRGVLLVAANEPNDEACSSGGNSFFYQFDYRSGSYLASSPGAVVGIKLGSALAAGFVVYRLPSGQLKYTGIDITGQKQTGGVLPGSAGSLGRRATWRELFQ